MVKYPNRVDLLLVGVDEGLGQPGQHGVNGCESGIRAFSFDADEGLIVKEDATRKASQASAVSMESVDVLEGVDEIPIMSPVVVVKPSPFDILARLREVRNSRAMRIAKKKSLLREMKNSESLLQEKRSSISWKRRVADWAGFFRFAQRLAQLRRFSLKLSFKKDIRPESENEFGDISLDLVSVSSMDSFSPSLNDSNKSLLSKSTRSMQNYRKYQTSPAQFQLDDDEESDDFYPTEFNFNELRRRSRQMNRLRAFSDQHQPWDEEDELDELESRASMERNDEKWCVDAVL